MAFDQATRNRLARFVSDVRSLLTEEFTRQFQHEYGLDPASGEITVIEKLTALDDARRETAQILRETLEYYLAGKPTVAKARQETLERILREQAFTVLNRLCALRMAEARGFILEAVAQGYRSKGFQLYARLAGSALSETSEAYRVYLFSLFDELSIELPPLFDRFNPQGRLFPREVALLRLLELLNDPELEALWAEDETIGWIYQYFNSKEERQAMRAESSAPRNSRELAVRNQFFTPRYVVEFLTDNTLGRIWYEMTKGQTTLTETCRYLVRRPDEVFLSPAATRGGEKAQDWASEAADWLRNGSTESFSSFNESDESRRRLIQMAAVVDGYQRYPTPQDNQPWDLERLYQSLQSQEDWSGARTQDLLDALFYLYRADYWSGGELLSSNREARQTLARLGNEIRRRFLESRGDDLSQESLLRAPVLTPDRTLKDPRELKMLDPACGSMHFGLYSFDLFEQIYIEAWDLEERLGPDALRRLADLEPLHQAYPDRDAFLRDVPRLIIERNIHGIDIDPRAAQIAGLSLWLRAQKSWQAQGLKLGERPRICKSNIVCAEPMPGDRGMLEEFLGTLKEEHLEVLLRNAILAPAGEKLRGTRAMADALAKLVRKVWQEMELAGEAGSLLKIEETLRDAIAAARKESKEKTPLFRVLEFGMEAGEQDQAGLGDDFWVQAEALVLGALQSYAEQAASGNSFRWRLFADDAVQGFALIDLCLKSYDVILMNPPYGSAAEATKPLLSQKYPSSWIEIYICFCEQALNLCSSNGLIGALTSRTWMYLKKFYNFRYRIISKKSLVFLLDLGSGVLDDAAVETSAWVFQVMQNQVSWPMFFDLENFQKKDEYLKTILESYSLGNRSGDLYIPNPISFLQNENISITYDQETSFGKTFIHGSSLYDAKPGLSTHDDFRFARLRWEIPINEIDQRWVCGIYGNQGTKYYADHTMVINWHNKGAEMKSFISMHYGSYSRGIRNESIFFAPGLTYQYTGNTFRVQVLPKGAIITMAGQGLYPKKGIDPFFLLGLLNSSHATRSLKKINPGRFFQASYVHSLRFSREWQTEQKNISHLARRAFHLQQKLLSQDETSPIFCVKNFRTSSNVQEVENLKLQLNEVFDNLEFNTAKLFGDEIEKKEEVLAGENEENDSKWSIHCDMSLIIGLIFGRWDARYAIGEKTPAKISDPFSALPACSPGMLLNNSGLPMQPLELPFDYPLRVSWGGILVDDESHYGDIVARTRDAIHSIWEKQSEIVEQKTCDFLGVETLRDYLCETSGFFSDHLKRYSKGRRQAPIYWPLSTPSGSYTLWLYYHRLSDQTLFSCVNDFVDPKLQQVVAEAARLRQKTGRSAADEKRMERLSDLERELKDFRSELLRAAAFWKPNLNDGVEITAAPLWKLFQHKPWQKRLKETWGKLEAGDYDWAHLAYSIWPERVREKCKSDKSLAIAHDLEHLYVESKTSAKKKVGRKKIEGPEMEGFFDED